MNFDILPCRTSFSKKSVYCGNFCLTYNMLYDINQNDPWLLQSLGSRQKVAGFLKPVLRTVGRIHENNCQQLLTPLQRAAPKSSPFLFWGPILTGRRVIIKTGAIKQVQRAANLSIEDHRIGPVMA